jgi:hypothetical protein
VKTSSSPRLRFVFSNLRPIAQLASNGKTHVTHPSRPLGSFFHLSSPRPNWLRSVIHAHIPKFRSALIAFSSLPLRKIAHLTTLVLSPARLERSLCYSISFTGCKLNWAPALQVTPDRVPSKLLSVAHQARQPKSSFSSGPKRPALVNLSHSQTQGLNRRHK